MSGAPIATPTLFQIHPTTNERDFPMAQIGQFTRTETGFTGRLHTLILYRELTLVLATPSDSENAPDYRIHHGDEDGPEIGAG